jgi:creatinine amidohydrolase
VTGAPLMAEMTWPEVEAAAARGAVALWSVGATEQHGPHLPLSVDTLIPHELSLRLSGGGQGFPGTTSLRAETLIAVVADVVGELARSGFGRIAIVNWHGENVNLLWAGVDRARERGELGEAKVMLVERVFNAFSEEEMAFLFADAREGFPGWPAEHAAIMETSLVMALRPELVRTELIADDRSAERPFYEVIPTPPEHVAPSGVLAEASKASPEKGERLAALIVDRLAAALRDF